LNGSNGQITIIDATKITAHAASSSCVGILFFQTPLTFGSQSPIELLAEPQDAAGLRRCGSLSFATGRTHLEFVVPLAETDVLVTRLAWAGPAPGRRERRGLGVVTWKGADTVATFLRRLGASAALLELEARGVARALRGDLNRVLNAESANLQRSVAAAGRQLAAIDQLDADGRLARQPYVVRSVAEARREHPDASLSDLATRLTIHRSAVQRALDRLERLALHDDEPVGHGRVRST